MLFGRRKLRIFALVAGGFAALLLAAGYFFAQPILTIDSGTRHADAIVVLGGGSGERPLKAAELFRGGAAPRVIISGGGDMEQNERMLLDHGVPADVIQIESASKSTRQNALFTIPLLRADGAHQVILVTSWYHSRRTLKCFRHYAPDIEFYSHPSYFGSERSARSGTHIGHYIGAEYVKLLGYWVCYGVPPM